METRSISLVLPMFNEIDYIEKTVSKAISVFESFIPDFEIIIVDDASNDGSEKIADYLSQNDRRIKVIHHKKNRKLGGVLKTGFSAASKEIVIYTDMDMPFDFSLLRKFIPFMDGADIINGYRIAYSESFKRKLYSKVYNILIKTIFGLKVRDVNFAMKVFKKSTLDALSLKSEGSFINAEALVKAQYLGYRILEVPVPYFLRRWGRSRLSSWRVIFKIIYEMVKLFPEIKLFSKKKVKYSKLKRFYEKSSLKIKCYNFIRFKTCPFDVIEGFIPNEGNIIDLGCGTGLFLNLLRLDSNKRGLLGFDVDEGKIRVAMESLNGSRDIRFEAKDISNSDFNLPQAKCITLVDILYYLNFSQKKELLQKCLKALDSDGVLIVKDIDRVLNLKFLSTFLQELLAVKFFHLNFGVGFYFGNRKEYLSLLEESGFVAEAFDLSEGYFYPHILYVGKKK